MNIFHEWWRDLKYSARHPVARRGLWVCIITTVFILAAAGFWWPAKRTQHELSDQIAAQRRELVQAQQAGKLMRAYAIVQKDVPMLEKKLKQAVSQAHLVDRLGRLARESGIRLLGEAYEERKDGSGRLLLMAELTVQGGYPAVRDFLRGIQSLPIWTEVQEIRLESSRDSNAIKGRVVIITHRPVLESRSS